MCLLLENNKIMTLNLVLLFMTSRMSKNIFLPVSDSGVALIEPLQSCLAWERVRGRRGIPIPLRDTGLGGRTRGEGGEMRDDATSRGSKSLCSYFRVWCFSPRLCYYTQLTDASQNVHFSLNHGGNICFRNGPRKFPYFRSCVIWEPQN